MFEDREEAGLKLSKKFINIKNEDALVLGIPRGGVIVAKKLAEKLNLPLDIVVVRKIGAPSNPELAIGAVGPKNTVYFDNTLISKLKINKRSVHHLVDQKEQERKERERILRGNKQQIDVIGKSIILVDDGVATGATVLVAQKYLRKEKVKEVILATPVIGRQTFSDIKKYFDDIITLRIEENFYAVGQFYKEFRQVEDEEVIIILNLP